MDSATSGKTEVPKKVTRRDIGIGFLFIGGVILMLTAMFYILSFMQQESFYLFSLRTHLVFDITIGISFIALGLFLARSRSAFPKDTD